MKKLNGLGWTSGVSIAAYGVAVGVRTNDAKQIGRIQARMPYGWLPLETGTVDILFSVWIGPPARRAGHRNYHLLYADAARSVRTLDLDELYDSLENQALLAVAYASPARLFVHAGVVAWNGKAIVIPGRTHSGKSTLVAELVQAGATYYSDEMAVFDGEGQVYPYLTPLTLRHANGRQRLDPADLGAMAAEQPLPVGLVLVTEYAEGGQWRPRKLTAGRALMALLDNTVAVRRTPDRALEILGKVAASATAVKSKRGDAASVGRKILDRLA